MKFDLPGRTSSAMSFCSNLSDAVDVPAESRPSRERGQDGEHCDEAHTFPGWLIVAFVLLSENRLELDQDSSDDQRALRMVILRCLNWHSADRAPNNHQLERIEHLLDRFKEDLRQS